MSELEREKMAREWNDTVPDPEEEAPGEAWEETYPDGSLKNECWKEEDRHA
ncbi:MAG: hypothetical protein K6E17_06480 [Clostridiales bacterium]|jgi:hypothetical protein|nr:hypothetical protein [Clostridiales bacterium]